MKHLAELPPSQTLELVSCNIPRPLVEALDLNPSAGPIVAFLRRQKSKAGFRTTLGCINRLAGFCGRPLHRWEPHAMGSLEIQSLALKVQNGTTKKGLPWAPAYTAAHEAALSGVLDQFWAFGMINQEQLARLKFWKRIQVRRSLQDPAKGRWVSPAERQRIWNATGQLHGSPLIQARDRAFLALLLCGLRREETTSVNVTDLLEDGLLRVCGKGERTRYLHLEHWTRTAWTIGWHYGVLTPGQCCCRWTAMGKRS